VTKLLRTKEPEEKGTPLAKRKGDETLILHILGANYFFVYIILPLRNPQPKLYKEGQIW